MKKVLLFGSIAFMVLAILGVAFAAGAFFVSNVAAQEQNPPDAATGWGRGGMMNGNGGMMGGRGAGNAANAPMHDAMFAALAEGLDLSVEELQTRVNNGETLYQIAQSKGLTDEQIQALFNDAHNKAMTQAVESNSLTQEQADWMNQRHSQMWQNGGPASGGCTGGGHGGRWNTTPAPQP